MFGVGINDSPDPVVFYKGGIQKECPYYHLWRGMITRGYSEKEKAKASWYTAVTVCEDWHRFSTFKAWMEAQDWEGKQLDKDILIPGNKVYSPETCAFVTQALNSFLTSSAKSRGRFPVGVYFHKQVGKFHAACRNPFAKKQEYLGVFVTPEEAHEAWRRRKHELACLYADIQTDQRVATALRTRFAPT